MSALAKFIPNVFAPLRQFGLPINVGGLFDISVRTNIRCHFPRPNERRRILRHGWKKRMQTAAGRRILMNRILKGKFVYSH